MDDETVSDLAEETGEALMARLKELAPKCQAANIESLVNAYATLVSTGQGDG